MNGDGPDITESESPSSSKPTTYGGALAEDFDRNDEGSDLDQDSALLTSDPLDESIGKAP